MLHAHSAGNIAGVRGLSLIASSDPPGAVPLANKHQRAAAEGSLEGEGNSPVNSTASLWKDAAERVSLHALVLKHLIGGHSQDAEQSNIDSGSERSTSGRYASTSAPQQGDAPPVCLLRPCSGTDGISGLAKKRGGSSQGLCFMSSPCWSFF